MRKTQNERTSSSKNGEYLILGRNSDFREKFGILELEMSHPGLKQAYSDEISITFEPLVRFEKFKVLNRSELNFLLIYVSFKSNI